MLQRDGQGRLDGRAVQRKLDRLREVYLEGNLDKTAYQTQKVALADRLAPLPESGDPENSAGERLARFLSDASPAWRVESWCRHTCRRCGWRRPVFRWEALWSGCWI